MGQLYLAVGRLEDCEQILDSLNQFETTPGLTPSFLFRSSLITRLRLLLRQSKWPEAAQAAEVAIREANAISDGTFLAVALFLKALAHHNQGMQSRKYSKRPFRSEPPSIANTKGCSCKSVPS